MPEAITLDSDLGLLSYLEALTFSFIFEGKRISPVLIYAEPDHDHPGRFLPIQAEETGFEGIACVDDTARAAVLALGAYEQTRDERALRLARRWLTFVMYMQYPDGEFANFVRNTMGRRNASGATSVKGGTWWTGRALWALARGYRVTGNKMYLNAYEDCPKPSAGDAKIHALLALGEAELFQVDGSHRRDLMERAVYITTCGRDYFRDHCDNPRVDFWGYHQLHATALAGRLLESRVILSECRNTLDDFVHPDIDAGFYYSAQIVPGGTNGDAARVAGVKDGLCAYCVSPIVQGLAEMHRATGESKYRERALHAARWFAGDNDAHKRMYDPETGLCSDGIDRDTVSPNVGAESSIEAGLAELERRALTGETKKL